MVWLDVNNCDGAWASLVLPQGKVNARRGGFIFCLALIRPMQGQGGNQGTSSSSPKKGIQNLLCLDSRVRSTVVQYVQSWFSHKLALAFLLIENNFHHV